MKYIIGLGVVAVSFAFSMGAEETPKKATPKKQVIQKKEDPQVIESLSTKYRKKKSAPAKQKKEQ